MVIKSLKLKNYRNYDLLDLNFDPSTNILYGDNAQGKTNILEALYLSGTTKSHRGTKDRDIIQFGYDESHIETIVEKRGVCFQIDMHLKKNSPKGIAIDKIPIRKAGELFGIVHFVFFSPEDLNIIKEGPAGRRRFIDLELSQLDKIYLSNLSNYNRIINQRNSLLKDIYGQKNLIETLDICPHRDDICFTTDSGLDVRRFGSQGQQRTAALSLKLSEIELVKMVIRDTPVLLLDDVLSELDKHRQNYLLDSIHDIQTIITCTGLDEFVNHRFSINKIFHIKNGHAVNAN